IRVTVQEPADTERPTGLSGYVQPFGGLRGMQVHPNVTRKDMLDLGLDYNANVARFQINTWSNDTVVLADKTNMAQWDAWFASKIAHLQSAILWARQAGIKLTVSMMIMPGGATAQVNNQVPYNSTFMLKYLASWRIIATTCLGAPEVIAFDIMNEPGYAFRTLAQGPGHDFRSAQIQVIDAIRGIDPGRWCIYQVNGYDEPNRFHYLRPIDRDRILYSVHMYKPTQLIASTNTTIAYPGGVVTNGEFLEDAFVGFASRTLDKTMLRQILEPVRRFQQSYQVPIYLSEFSICRWVPGAAAYLQDVADIADEYGWMWTYHAFREANSWDVEYEALPANQGGGVPASGVTDRSAVLRAKFALNVSAYTAAQQAPIAPTISVTDTWTTDVRVDWTPARCLIGSWLVEYRPAGGSWTQFAVARNQTSKLITGLSIGVSYEYRVTLINAHGQATSSVVEATKGAAYMLDVIAGSPSYAYSTRQLKASYTGPCIRVRRADDAEKDINFLNGDLDMADLVTFANGTSAWLRTKYDVTGNGRHQYQASKLNQPRIVSAGVVDVVGARAAINYIGASNHWMSGAFASLYAAGAATIVGVWRNNGSAADSYLFGETSSADFDPFYDLTSGSAQSGEVKFAIRDDASATFCGNGGSLQVQGFTSGTTRAFRVIDTGSAIRVASNTTAEAQDTTYNRATHTLTANQTAIGARLRQTGADKFASMSVGEIIAFPSVLSSADLAVIQAHQVRWYGL
ncbi:MAG: cellulase family glycosylhydrolase, partial [Fibrobacterota bacterium]